MDPVTGDTVSYTFPADCLREFTVDAFKHFGVPDADARLAADVLIKSDLRGIDSHGVARLHTYFEMLELGRINPKPKIKIVRERASVATVDGDNGLGLVVGPKANDIAMDKAEEHGSGWVSVCNTNHFGIAGYYPLKALERDLIGWAMTNTTKLVAPLWGAERMLGTNPIAIAFPGLKEPPIVIDMATSAVAYGKIEIALRKNEPVPKGWIVDKKGGDTTNPRDMIDGGAQLPLGSDREMGGHKGYGLASMVDILCCVLSGANWGPFAPPFALRQEIPERSVGKGIGHFFGAMQIEGFIDKDEFKNQIDEWIKVFRNTKPAPGTNGPLIPGDPEREAEAIRSKEGIPLLKPVVDDLLDISKRTGIPFKGP
ncbi:MAG TPA: Ldh family oxidoreductase [Candidatus Binatia bacterium]|jgi:L-2-hydroxycarboxylate dehydrogenase (NAD+)|nr:Ldh family oxidoreductase [Candidatus Binatia bacterium]